MPLLYARPVEKSSFSHAGLSNTTSGITASVGAKLRATKGLIEAGKYKIDFSFFSNLYAAAAGDSAYVFWKDSANITPRGAWQYGSAIGPGAWSSSDKVTAFLDLPQDTVQRGFAYGDISAFAFADFALANTKITLLALEVENASTGHKWVRYELS